MSSTSTGPGSSRVTVELPELSDTERVEYPEFLVSYRSISGDGTTGPWLDGGRVNSDSGRVTLPENLSDGSYEVRVHGSSSDGRTRSQPSPSLAFSVAGVGRLFCHPLRYLCLCMFECLVQLFYCCDALVYGSNDVIEHRICLTWIPELSANLIVLCKRGSSNLLFFLLVYKFVRVYLCVVVLCANGSRFIDGGSYFW